MKVELFNWCGERKVTEVLEALDCQHGEIVEDDILALADQFIEHGLNIMILKGHSSLVGQVDYVLALDTKSFGQR